MNLTHTFFSTKENVLLLFNVNPNTLVIGIDVGLILILILSWIYYPKGKETAKL